MFFEFSIDRRYHDPVVEQYSQAGFLEMSRHTAVICCMVRDCGPALKRNILQIEALRSRFRDSWVIVIENDSKDNSKEALQAWAARSPGVILVSQDFGNDTIPPTGRRRKFFSAYRIEKMIKYRNMYLDQIDSLGLDPSYMIVLDPDVWTFSISGIAHTFGQPVPWDAVTSNGIAVEHKWRGLYRYPIFYDTYALRESGDLRPQTMRMINYAQHAWAGLLPGFPMIRVASGFNGMAVYRMEAVRGLRYVCEPNEDPDVEVLCEHVSFHRQMASRGFDRIYVNPAQVVIYETVWQNYRASAERALALIGSKFHFLQGRVSRLRSASVSQMAASFFQK